MLKHFPILFALVALPAAAQQSPITTIWQSDAQGRMIGVVGTPGLSNYNGTYNCFPPYQPLHQPLGIDSQFIMCGTFGVGLNLSKGVNMLSVTAFDQADSQAGGGITPILGSYIGDSPTSGGSGIAALGDARVRGAIAIGAQLAATAEDSGTTSIAALLLAGGDGKPGHSILSYLSMQSGSANNSSNWGIDLYTGSGINPFQPTGTIMGAGAPGIWIANGIDFSNLLFSGSAFKSPGFDVNGQTGAVTIGDFRLFVDTDGKLKARGPNGTVTTIAQP